MTELHLRNCSSQVTCSLVWARKTLKGVMILFQLQDFENSLWDFETLRLCAVDTPGAKKVIFITVINEQHFSYTYLSQDFGYCERFERLTSSSSLYSSRSGPAWLPLPLFTLKISLKFEKLLLLNYQRNWSKYEIPTKAIPALKVSAISCSRCHIMT